MKKVAILQSNYIPWKGYFDIINMVDLFIFHDDLQYTSGDWRNRNKIKTPQGTEWLTVPCGKSEKRYICDVELKDHTWQKKHWNKIVQHYKKSRYFEEYEPFFKKLYLETTWDNLSVMNQTIIRSISKDILGISTIFDDSRNYNLQHKKAQRVIELLKKSNATLYLSGPAAKDYLDEQLFVQENIELVWMDYSGYPEYVQPFPPFRHDVTILDLIFNTGDKAKTYMKSFS